MRNDNPKPSDRTAVLTALTLGITGAILIGIAATLTAGTIGTLTWIGIVALWLARGIIVNGSPR